MLTIVGPIEHRMAQDRLFLQYGLRAPSSTPDSGRHPLPAIRTQPPPKTPYLPQRQYIYPLPHSNSRRLPQSTDHTVRTGAWSSGFGWRVNGGGFQQPKCRGFDSQAAKQNLHKKKTKEGFRTRLPLPDRRVGLVGELFVFSFFFLGVFLGRMPRVKSLVF